MLEKNGIDMTAITWNMGNKPATKAVVAEFKEQLTANGQTPDVIAISTQEELAPNGKRLQDQLLKALNKGLRKEEQYVLVKTKQPQYHTTMAGANNSIKTLATALLTDNNRVSTAVLVKKPLRLQEAKAQIDYEPRKDKGNKSVITITGDLVTKDGMTTIPLSISGGHWDSNSDKKRRAHTNKSLESLGIKSPQEKSYYQIFKEASTLQMVMGDFNERDYLMKGLETKDNLETKDKGYQSNYQSYGFDMGTSPTQIVGDITIHGTYGFKFNNNDLNDQDKSAPDPRGRANVAKGGYLDKVAVSSGLDVDSQSYGAQLNEKYFQPNKGKWFYHGSDHIPVIRSMNVTAPQQGEEAKIVANYTKRRLPDFSEDIKDLKFLLANAKNIEELTKNAQSLQYHDSTLSAQAFVKQLSGVDSENLDIIRRGLEAKLAQKQSMQNSIEAVKNSIDEACIKSPVDKAALVSAFNQITRCNELRNSALEVMGSDPNIFSEQDKSVFMKIAEKLVDLSFQQALCNISRLPNPNQEKLQAQQQLMDDFIKKHPIAMENFKNAKNIATNTIYTASQRRRVTKTPTENINLPEQAKLIAKTLKQAGVLKNASDSPKSILSGFNHILKQSNMLTATRRAVDTTKNTSTDEPPKVHSRDRPK